MNDVRQSATQSSSRRSEAAELHQYAPEDRLIKPRAKEEEAEEDEEEDADDKDVCPALVAAESDINTVDVFKDFDFQVGLFSFLKRKK